MPGRENIMCHSHIVSIENVLSFYKGFWFVRNSIPLPRYSVQTGRLKKHSVLNWPRRRTETSRKSQDLCRIAAKSWNDCLSPERTRTRAGAGRVIGAVGRNLECNPPGSSRVKFSAVSLELWVSASGFSAPSVSLGLLARQGAFQGPPTALSRHPHVN